MADVLDINDAVEFEVEDEGERKLFKPRDIHS